MGAVECSLSTESNLAHSFATIYHVLGQFDRALPYAKRSRQLYERRENEGTTSGKLMAKANVANLYPTLGSVTSH